MFSDESPEMILQYLYESLQGLDSIHAHGWIHMDFKPENVFVGNAVKDVEHAFLGDLALVSVEEISQLRLIPTRSSAGEKSRSYAVLKMGPNGSIAASRQIGITPGYFNPDHINALIDYAKNAAKEARSNGLDPNKIKIPKDVLALGDNNQVGVSLERYKSFLEGFSDGKMIPGKKKNLAKQWNIPVSEVDGLISGLGHYVKEFKNPKSNVTILELMAAVDAARTKLIRARISASELPKPITI